jgi:SAM-dependent methyltransferase
MTTAGHTGGRALTSSTISAPSASTVLSAIRNRPRLKAAMKKCLSSIGYDTTDWVRVAMYRHAFGFIEQLTPEQLRVMEISAGSQWRSRFAFKSFTGTSYPSFDICKDVLTEQFDLVIADQIFEHLKWPARAARNVYAMVRPGGYFIIATPFLVRYHPSPIDCNRWTAEGLSYFLQEAGFPEAGIQTFAWGNRACLKANLSAWRKRGFFGSLRNEPDYPIMVWAFAQKPFEPGRTPA